MLQESLSTTELVVWGLVILALAVVILVAFVLVERPPRRGQVRVHRRPRATSATPVDAGTGPSASTASATAHGADQPRRRGPRSPRWTSRSPTV